MLRTKLIKPLRSQDLSILDTRTIPTSIVASISALQPDFLWITKQLVILTMAEIPFRLCSWGAGLHIGVSYVKTLSLWSSMSATSIMDILMHKKLTVLMSNISITPYHLSKHIPVTWAIVSSEYYVSIWKILRTNESDNILGAFTHDALQLKQ